MRLRPLAIAAACAAAALSCKVLAQEAPAVSEAALRAHLSFLADDLLEGRGTGQRGGALAVRYLETQAAAIGLKPMPGGGYRQKLAIEGTRLLPGSAVSFEAGGKRLEPKPGEGIVFGTGSGQADLPLMSARPCSRATATSSSSTIRRTRAPRWSASRATTTR